MTQPVPIHALKPSQLRKPADDVNIDEFNLMLRNKLGIKAVSAVTDAVIDRTIEGASTLTITVDDDNARTIQKSGRLGRKVDTELDGTFWTLVGVKKAQRKLTLTLEEREVNVLRYYSSWIIANRANTTRAQFVKRMLDEVKEIPLKYVIPELNVVEKISDVQPGQILVDNTGAPVTTPDPSSQVQAIPQGSKLTVKGEPATQEQINNANMILQKGIEMGANRKVLVSSIMTAIDESRIINLAGGDRDSVGVFQQRPSQGWPASRDVPTDAAAYFKEAIALDKQNPNLPIQLLCQGVQRSFDSTGSNYAAFQAEAEQWVTAFGMGKTSLVKENATSGKVVDPTNNTKTDGNQLSAVQTGNYFSRGQITKKGTSTLLTPENSWNCIQRLAQDVNWRAFCVNGTIYFVSEQWLFKSKPFLRVSEDTEGIDWIDYDYDEGKRQATLTITAHASRWSVPPGCIIEVFDMGIINGRWLVSEINRSLFDTIATITATKPLPVLPEPTTLNSIPQGVQPPTPAGQRAARQASAPNQTALSVIEYARKAVGLPYQYGAEEPGVAFDCSGLTQAAYSSVGVSIPRGAQNQYDSTPKIDGSKELLLPGDLVFFGTDTQHIEHVGIYIGNGAMIDAPHTGAFVRVDNNFMNWTNPSYVGATRPWQA